MSLSLELELDLEKGGILWTMERRPGGRLSAYVVSSSRISAKIRRKGNHPLLKEPRQLRPTSYGQPNPQSGTVSVTCQQK
jgi:hypothetical protein